MRRASLAILLALAAGPAMAADPTVTLRTGEHHGFGRLVFEAPAGVTEELVREGDRLVVRFSTNAAVDSAGHAPHNVSGITTSPGQAELSLSPGATIRRMRIGGRLVIDVLDPSPADTPHANPPASRKSKAAMARARSSAPAHAPSSVLAGASTPQPAPTEPPPQPPAQQASPAPPALAPTMPASAPVARVAQASLPDASAAAPAPAALLALSASVAPVSTGADVHAMRLPFDAGTGAAAFRRGDSAVIVFDQRRPIDMAPLHDDPVFGSGAVQLLPGATVLRLPLAPQTVLRLARNPSGWTVTAFSSIADVPKLRPIRANLADGAVRLAADASGQVISVPDPETGGVILVGTQTQPGQSMAVARRTPEFALLPGFQGVALLPVSDSVSLRTTPQGFLIEAGAGRALAMSAEEADVEAQADARHFSRRFDFQDLPPDALHRRLLAAIDAAAATPARARGPKRIAVAQAMLALGMGAEAQGVLALAAAADPRLADDPDQRGLSAIAALVAGRPAEAGALDDPSLSGTDDIALWRAVRAAMAHEGAPEAAPVFAADIALPLAYPKALRAHILPLMAETMALAGEREAAKQLLDRHKGNRRLDLARGFLAEADSRADSSNPQPALDIYDRVASGSDQLAHARAAVSAVELRMSRLGLPPAQGADALDRLLYAWRGDERELALRRRIAELRRAAGQWRPALDILRESEQLFPDQRPVWHALLVDTFSGALSADAAKPLPPLDLVALAEENADLIPDGDAGQALAARLADRLVALDLPQRAVPVLERLAARTPSGPARAAFGGRLAAMRLSDNDAQGALAALTASAADDLPPQLLESRTLTFARAAASTGDLPQATAALAALGTLPAIALRADLLEAAKDWPAAISALRDDADRTLPAQGVLTDAQARLMLRLASAAGQAGDESTLAELRQTTLSRLPPGQLAEMFRVLTQGPVQGVADLPRAANEVKLARALPAALNTLSP
jgi:hypothetical protein